MAAEGSEAPMSQSRFSVRGAAPAAGTQQDGFSTPVSRRPSRSITSEALGPSPRKPTPSRGSLIPRKGSVAGPQRDQIAGVTLCLLKCYQENSLHRYSVCTEHSDISCEWLSSCAERVKVVVRVRPPRASETGGAIKVAPDHRGIVLNREYALSSLTEFTSAV